MKTSSLIKAIGISTVALFLSNTELKAQKINTPQQQDYTDAVGLRFGGTTGLSVKHKFNSYNAIEIIAGTYPHAIGITGLYERYVLTNVDGLNFYFGAGGHIARGYFSSWGYDYNPDKDQYYYYSGNYYYGPIIGIDAIGGAEYKFRDTPVALSFDLKPYAEFYRGSGPHCRLDPGLGVRFTF
ncbi:MAG: hypothetical protein ACXVNQ_08265 [Bacteroidia bacterium]